MNIKKEIIRKKNVIKNYNFLDVLIQKILNY